MSRQKRTAEEEAILAKAAKYLPGGSTGNIFFKPDDAMIIKEALGSKVWDYSGNEYIDFLLGSGPMLVGHSHPDVVAAVMEVIGKGSTYFSTNGAAVELAEEMVNAVPCAEQVRFLSSGSEATYFAMKAARAFRGRDKILKFEGGYHGTNDYALMSVTPTELREFPRPSRNSAGIPAVLENEVLVCPFNDLETTQAVIEKHHDELGAVITECCQRIIPPKPGFLQGLREITSHYQIPLIFDEVVTGFRWSYGGAQEYYGVTPDMATFGKAVGGGYPLSAVAGREEIMRVFDPVSKEEGTFVPGVGTLSGNPIAATAGLATLKILKGQGGVDRIWETGDKLMAELDRMLKEKEIQGTVVGEAPCFDVYFGVDEVTNYRDTLKADNAMMSRFNHAMLESGVLKGDSKYYIASAHTDEDVAKTIEAMDYSLDQARG